MANTTLNARIQLKYDTYVNWTTNNPVLLAGEVAVTTVQSAQAPVSQVPAILFKVGDGTNNFNTLNWASAIAADVYPWAKASVKPTYQASEIEGLEDYISGQIEDTDTQYQIIASGTNGIQLQSRPKTGGVWTNVGSPITITYTLETGTTNGTVSFNGTEVAVKGLGSAAYTESSAYDAAGTAAGVQTAVIGTSGDQSSAITIYGTRKYAAEQATAAQTAATTAANSYTDGQITQTKTDLIGTGDATSNTIKGAVAESKTYADTQIAAKGVPSTEGVPTDYLLSPAGWVAPPSGGGDGKFELIADIALQEEVNSVKIASQNYPNLTNKQKLLVRIRTYPNTLTSGWIRMWIGNSHNVEISDANNNSALIVAAFEVIGGYWGASFYKTSNKDVSGKVPAPYPIINKEGDFFSKDSPAYQPYDSIEIYGHNLTFPVGTMITIFGA